MSDEENKTLKDIHDYWKSRSLPELYLDQLDRSEFLTEYVKTYINQHERILEIGCNAGRNLNHLYEHDFKQLFGIEISEEAIVALKKVYPTLAENAKIFHFPVEDIIRELSSQHFDLVFTMAVLEHIHPDSEWIFEHMARITGSYLITVEAEKAEHWRLFPRNYKEVFENQGMKQIEETHCKGIKGLGAYTLRVFEK